MGLEHFEAQPGTIRVCIEADTSYQVKRIITALEKVKGLRMMKYTGVKPNRKKVPRLFVRAVFSDDKSIIKNH